MLGTTLIIAGIAGFAAKAYSIYKDTLDPPITFPANVAKIRLDTKKDDGIETYTYIITFFINEIQTYASFKVPQKQFDEIMEKDTGFLTCKLKRRKFIEWKLAKTI
jgi:hypothetical protein